MPIDRLALARLAAALFFGAAVLPAGVAQAQANPPVPRAAPRAAARVPGAAAAAPTDDADTGDSDFDNPNLLPDGPDPDPAPAAPAETLAPAAPLNLAAPPAPAPSGDQKPLSFELLARMTAEGPPLTTGMTWRVFSSEPGSDARLKLVVEAHGGTTRLTLTPGTYFVYAAYGRAGATRKIVVGGPTASDEVILNAGGIRLSALAGKEQTLAPGDVSFDIYAPDEDGSEERVLLVPNAPAGHVIGLNAGTYHVVSRYGDANAVVRADIRVEAGKLTDATIYQNAARLTLKLVSDHGGEALADTAWSVVTPSGERVADSVGAFPSVVLAVGDYTAIAKHDGKIFESSFTVEAGLNRDVEVIATR